MSLFNRINNGRGLANNTSTNSNTGNKPVCQFYLEGRCKFGSDCRNYHPPKDGNSTLHPAQLHYYLNADHIKADLTTGEERPAWPLSAYGPGRDAPRQLLEGVLEQSPEELRVQCYLARAQGSPQHYERSESEALEQANSRAQGVLNDLDGAIKYVIDGKDIHPNREDGVHKNASNFPWREKPSYQPGDPASSASTFGQASTMGSNAPSPSNFGQPSTFGQTSAFGSNRPTQPAASGFGQPSNLGGASSPFGAAKPSAFGSPSPLGGGGASAFGKPSALGAAGGGSAFGQASALGGTSPFGSGTGSAFGQASALGATSPFGGGNVSSNNQGSAFGQASSLAGSGSAFGKPSAFASASPFATSTSQPSAGTSIFGQASTSGQAQSAFGQPSAPGQAQSRFGQRSIPGQGQAQSAFGQPSVPGQQQRSIFGQPSATGQQQSSPFGQPSAPNAQQSTFGGSASNSAFGQSSNTKLSTDQPTTSPFGTKSQGTTATPFGNAAAPTTNKPLNPHLFPTGLPTPNSDVEAGDSSVYSNDDALAAALKEIYLYVREHGRFKNGIVPEVPPLREWVGWDI